MGDDVMMSMSEEIEKPEAVTTAPLVFQEAVKRQLESLNQQVSLVNEKIDLLLVQERGPRAHGSAFSDSVAFSKKHSSVLTESFPSRRRADNTTKRQTAFAVDRTSSKSAGVDHVPVSTMADLRRVIEKKANRTHSLRRRPWQVIIWRFIEDPRSSMVAFFYSHFAIAFQAMSVILAWLQIIGSGTSTLYLNWSGTGAQMAQIVFEVFFLFELAARFITCPSRYDFSMDPFTFVDLVTVAPLPLRCVLLVSPAFKSEVTAAVLLAVPAVRLVKILRRFEQFHLIVRAFTLAAEALPVLMYALGLVVLCFALLFFYAERDDIESLPKAVWFTVVTISTVGYGDVTPKTPFGYFITGVLIAFTNLYLAMPIGIVGTVFSAVWADRRRILLVHRIRRNIIQAGYSAEDIFAVFEVLDTDNSGVLEYPEFHTMVQIMEVGVSEEIVQEVFNVFDEDSTGSVNVSEFLSRVFPRTTMQTLLGRIPKRNSWHKYEHDWDPHVQRDLDPIPSEDVLDLVSEERMSSTSGQSFPSHDEVIIKNASGAPLSVIGQGIQG